MMKSEADGIIRAGRWLATHLSPRVPVGLYTHEVDYGDGRKFFWIPVSLGLVICVIVIGFFNSGSGAFIVAVTVLVVSVYMGWQLRQSHIHAVNGLLHESEYSRKNCAAFYNRVFPVWSRQIESSRQIGDKAVADLTVLFGEITTRLEAMLKLTRENIHAARGDENGFLAAIEKSQNDFEAVFNDLKMALQAVNDSKDMILAEVTMHSADMREMALDAQQMAMQSRIVALNAEIEAARAGESGKAFAAVVSEMRHLSNHSAETSLKMEKRVQSIDEAMARFYKEEQQMAHMEEMHVSRAEEMFDDIVRNFGAIASDLEESVSVMEEESRRVKNDISSSLVKLQYQDRLSQIMAHVSENINALNELTDDSVLDLDVEEWLADMQSGFSVDEEYVNLSGDQKVIENNHMVRFF